MARHVRQRRCNVRSQSPSLISGRRHNAQKPHHASATGPARCRFPPRDLQQSAGGRTWVCHARREFASLVIPTRTCSTDELARRSSRRVPQRRRTRLWSWAGSFATYPIPPDFENRVMNIHPASDPGVLRQGVLRIASPSGGARVRRQGQWLHRPFRRQPVRPRPDHPATHGGRARRRYGPNRWHIASSTGMRGVSSRRSSGSPRKIAGRGSRLPRETEQVVAPRIAASCQQPTPTNGFLPPFDTQRQKTAAISTLLSPFFRPALRECDRISSWSD